jgi:acetyltransferase
MAGPDFLYNGILKQAGVIRVGSIEELYANGWALATQPPLRGRRVGIMTNSGGPATAIAYTCDLAGLEVPRFSESLQKEIKQYIEPHASAANPVDMTFHSSMEKLAVSLPEIMMKSGEVDAIVLHGVLHSGFMQEIYNHVVDLIGGISLEEFLKLTQPVIAKAFELPHKYKMPMLVSSFFGREDGYTKGYQNTNTPVFHSPENAARALGSLYHYKQIRERKPVEKIVLPAVSKLATRLINQAKANGQKALDEHAAKRLLAQYGVPVTKEILASTKAQALDAARKIGYPVALKACSWEIMHKSGKGLIALNIENANQLKDNFQSIQKAAGKPVPVLVQEMLQGSREFLAGMTRFAGFGPCVVFGLGGIFTEIYRDTTIRMAPLADADVQEMFADIRARKLLEEFRGMPEVKIKKLTQIIQAVGNISLLHPEIAEIDLNPIIISGAMPIIADALILLTSNP